jgi:hypothetical protein
MFMNITNFPGNIMPTNGTYIICIKGHLDDRWFHRFEGLTISRLDSGETIISSPTMDQAALFGVLHRIRDLAVELISVQKYEEPQHPNPVTRQ